ncbi:MAG: hypothetical protein NWE88_11810 [Candidatus Bathyarchaeota archaeon]|nr:hypothetical protein [Candidatus Bathyarchaeota archaeon]
MREAEVQRYVIENLEDVFPGMSLIGVEELLLERYRVDLHLRDTEGIDVFVEITSGKINRRKAGQILNYYSILANLDPPLKKYRFIVLGEDISEDADDILDSFGVEVALFRDLSIDEQKVSRHLYSKNLENVLTATESGLLSYIKARRCGLVNVHEAQEFLNIDAGYASKIMGRLAEKGYLERITRGRYLFIPLEYGYDERYPPMNSLVVGSVLAAPYYYGYQTANNHYGFTSQFSPKAYICTVKPRRSFRWRNTSYKFVTLVDDKFFGFTKIEADGCEVNIAEPEKTVLDSLDKPGYCGGIPFVSHVLSNAFSSDIDLDKLLSYSVRMGSNAVIHRLGYLVELLSERGYVSVRKDFLDALAEIIPEGNSHTYLGPVGTHGRKGPVEGRWKMIVNVDEATVLSELEVK